MGDTDLTLSRRQSLAAVLGGMVAALGACSSNASENPAVGGTAGTGDTDGASAGNPDNISDSNSGATTGGANSSSATAGSNVDGSAPPSDGNQDADDGGAGATPIADCTLTPEQEEGPYFVELAKVRKNIIDSKDGVPLTLRITVVDVKDCRPVEGAAIDVWHCDAAGDYSTASNGMFLRGVQLTDAQGVLEFTTIYPGWYPGRTNHIHVKVHIGSTASATLSGGHVSHTGNLFFTETESVAVAALAPYSSNSNKRTVLTADFVYQRQSGSSVVMEVKRTNAASPADGYVASFTLGIDPSATPALIGIHG